MSNDPLLSPGRTLGSLLQLIVVLIVLGAVLPVITPYVVTLAIVAIVGRAVWYFTRH